MHTVYTKPCLPYTVNCKIIFFPNCVYEPEDCSHAQKPESPDNVNKQYGGRARSEEKNRDETVVGKQFFTYVGNTL